MSIAFFPAPAKEWQASSHVPSHPRCEIFPCKRPLIQIPSYPFQPLPPPNGPAPYRFDLSQLLSAGDIQQITNAGIMVFHTVGDTGDYRGQQQDFVAAMMTQDAQKSA